MADKTATPSVAASDTPAAETIAPKTTEASSAADTGSSSAKPRSKKPSSTVADASPITDALRICAGCGEKVVFDQSSSVGGRSPIVYHGCGEMHLAVDAWFLATLNDPQAVPPATEQ